MEYQVSSRAPFPLYLLNVSVTFVSFCFFPSIIFLFSLCSRASPRFHLPQTDCHGLKEETPCSSAQLLIWHLRRCPYPGSERDESAPSLLCPHSLLDSFPVTKNEINHGRTTGARGKGTVHSADRQRQNERCQRRLWSLQGTAQGNLTGVLPLRSPLTPLPPAPTLRGGVGSAPDAGPSPLPGQRLRSRPRLTALMLSAARSCHVGEQ